MIKVKVDLYMLRIYTKFSTGPRLILIRDLHKIVAKSISCYLHINLYTLIL